MNKVFNNKDKTPGGVEEQARIQQFLKEYEALTKKYEVDVIGVPTYLPENGGWKLVIRPQAISTRQKKDDKPFVVK